MSFRPICMIIVLFAAMIFVACDDGGGGSGLDDGVPEDGDTGEPNYCTEPEWSPGAFEVGEVVGNWSFTGYIDSDRDGVVEEDVVQFDLDQVNCLGFNSLVLMIGTTS